MLFCGLLGIDYFSKTSFVLKLARNIRNITAEKRRKMYLKGRNRRRVAGRTFPTRPKTSSLVLYGP